MDRFALTLVYSCDKQEDCALAGLLIERALHSAPGKKRMISRKIEELPERKEEERTFLWDELTPEEDIINYYKNLELPQTLESRLAAMTALAKEMQVNWCEQHCQWLSQGQPELKHLGKCLSFQQRIESIEEQG